MKRRLDFAIIDFEFILPEGCKINDLFLNNREDYRKKNIEIPPVVSHSYFCEQDYLGKKGYKYYSRSSRLLCSTIQRVYDRNKENLLKQKLRVGISTGTTFGGMEEIAILANQIKQGGINEISPMTSMNFSPNIPSSIGAIRIGAKAFNVTFTTNFGAGLDALGFGIEAIEMGQADMVFCSGVEDIGLNFKERACTIPNQNSAKIGDGSCTLLVTQFSKIINEGDLNELIILRYFHSFFIDSNNLENKNIFLREISHAIDLICSKYSSCRIALINAQSDESFIMLKSIIYSIVGNKILVLNIHDSVSECFSVTSLFCYPVASLTLSKTKKKKETAYAVILNVGEDGYVNISIIESYEK